MNVHLPVDVSSPDQLSGLIAELHTYRNHLRDATVRAKAKSKTSETPEMSGLLATLLRGSGVAADSGDSLEALEKELAAILKNAPVMHLTFAAPAGRTLKRQLAAWFRTQIHPHSLLTFAARSDIGGGLMMQAGSHFYDYSFASRILANKARLTEVTGV